MSATMNHFALQLSEWHGGMNTGLYAVSSCLMAEKSPDFNDMIRAVKELRKENNTECTKLANTLQLMLETRVEYCATYQKYLKDHSL